MRTTDERKAETRERILAAAGELFRSHGIDAIGVDAIMHKAGLTHGGFYAHFASKEALVAAASAAALARSAARWERIARDELPAGALARIVGNYLDAAHVAEPERGCVLATLGPEVARRHGARAAITDSLRRMLGALEQCLPGRRQRAMRAMAMLSTMVGAVVLARLCNDQDLASDFLAAARWASVPK
jgi:TetR/AcrR family transcriptional regulator, transcriptional repressor for nem operon